MCQEVGKQRGTTETYHKCIFQLVLVFIHVAMLVQDVSVCQRQDHGLSFAKLICIMAHSHACQLLGIVQPLAFLVIRVQKLIILHTTLALHHKCLDNSRYINIAVTLFTQLACIGAYAVPASSLTLFSSSSSLSEFKDSSFCKNQ